MGLANLKLLDTKIKRVTRTSNDTILVTPLLVKGWMNPSFQRPLRINDKVRALAEEIKINGGVIPGVITLGCIGPKDVYLIDGQHRREAFLLSELDEGYCDVRKHVFESSAEMGEEFINLNSHLVPLKPDDILRGFESSLPTLQFIRKECPFVGYDFIRRNDKAPILSMSKAIRSWHDASHDTPARGGGSSVAVIAQHLTMEEAKEMCRFYSLAFGAWGRETEYSSLWAGLNLCLCMWLYRRVVLGQGHSTTTRNDRLTTDQFTKCLMAVSADPHHVEWLRGRKMSDRDRAPAYNRIKDIMSKRIALDMGSKARLPRPEWAHGSGR